MDGGGIGSEVAMDPLTRPPIPESVASLVRRRGYEQGSAALRVGPSSVGTCLLHPTKTSHTLIQGPKCQITIWGWEERKGKAGRIFRYVLVL